MKLIDPDIHFRVLRKVEENPYITQRELAKHLGVSLGGVNYCLKALIEVGQIKIKNFTKNNHKTSYLYLLTPHGIQQKTILTAGFLRRKLAEYKSIKLEIESLKSSL